MAVSRPFPAQSVVRRKLKHQSYAQWVLYHAHTAPPIPEVRYIHLPARRPPPAHNPLHINKPCYILSSNA